MYALLIKILTFTYVHVKPYFLEHYLGGPIW